MARKKIDFSLFQKKCPSQPTAEYIEKEFEAFLLYCEVNNQQPIKESWNNFLGASRQQRNSWVNATRGINTISEEEFLLRRDTLKKIDDFIEESLAYHLITTEKTNGSLIFYMKNAFKWRDKPEDEDKSINVQIGVILPKKRREDSKK